MRSAPVAGVVLGVALTMAAVTVSGGERQAGERPQGGLAVDLSGVERYLEITALLERNLEPTPAQWDSLFATPGYAVLTASEFTRQDFERRFRLAFMPSRQAELEARLKTETGFNAQFLPHYVKARTMRGEIERRLTDFRTAAFADEALARARRFLPSSLPDGQPKVAFVVFAPDARGYNPVVIDILLANDREEFLDIVAHEFHHWYRTRLAPDFSRDADILWVIQQLQLEGIADLINVPAWIGQRADTWSPPNRQFVEYYRKSPEIIATLDALLSRMPDEPKQRRALGQQLRRALPRSGHPTGYFMAETIVAALGRDALIGTIPNPFAFFPLYDEAARKKGGDTPRFSKKALDFVASLEARYGQ